MQCSLPTLTDGSAPFGCDLNGNLTSDGSRTYVYDIENRLVSATPLPGVAGSPAALVYDPLGRLFQVSTPIVGVTRFLYDGDALVVEYNGGNFMARRHLHLPAADRPALTFEKSGLDKPFWLHADHQGSVVALSAGNGAATINRYDEYGIPAATNAGRFQYTGQAWLAELGMYYYKARIYSPTLGRFMQTDPVGYDDQFNLYAYVGNDPVNHTDPQGTYRCGGNREQCAAAERSINDVRRAARDPNLSSADRRTLSGIAQFYGRAGERNGVVVIFAPIRQIQEATGSQSAAATVVRGPRTGVIGVVLPNNFPTLFNDLRRSPSAVGRDLSRFSERAERAAVVAHEGKHGRDMRNGIPIRERPAYDAGRAVARSMGAIPFRDLPEDDD